MATGVVYFHRFYMFHTFQDFSRYVSTTQSNCPPMIPTFKQNTFSLALADCLGLPVSRWKSGRNTKKM